jgi:branched-chain amino acid transport system substrate-binding protein
MRSRRLLLAALILFACHHESPAIKVGLFTGTTGATAAWGEAIQRGATMALGDFNAGRRGPQVQLLVEDDQGRPEQSASVAEQFATRDGVVALIGGDTSSRSLAAAPIAERYGIVMVSPTASAPPVTRGKHYVFRVCATDDYEALAVARLARQRLHASRVAILRDTKNDYSVGMAATFTQAFTNAGGTIAGTYDYAAEDSDFRSQLTSVRAASADLLFVPGYYGDVAQIASQARDLGITIPLVGGSGWDSPKLVEIGGKAVEGCWFVSGMRSASPRFVTEFRKRYGSEPDSANAQAYDAASIIFRAIAQCGNHPGRQCVRNAVAGTRDFPGASGTITLGLDGNALKPLGVFRVVEGRFVQDGAV